jgi:hypothetical protein
LAEQREARSAKGLVPAVPKVQHRADGIKELDVLQKKLGLIDTLIVVKSWKGVATVAATSKDDCLAGSSGKAHFRKESAHRVFLDLIELVVVKAPSGERIANTWEPDAAIAHEGFIACQGVESDALCDGVTAC